MTWTQRELIEIHLIRHGVITPKEAMEKYGIMRLAARAKELGLYSYDMFFTNRRGASGVCRGYAGYKEIATRYQKQYEQEKKQREQKKPTRGRSHA